MHGNYEQLLIVDFFLWPLAGQILEFSDVLQFNNSILYYWNNRKVDGSLPGWQLIILCS